MFVIFQLTEWKSTCWLRQARQPALLMLLLLLLLLLLQMA
jgi:hypothetical protein